LCAREKRDLSSEEDGDTASEKKKKNKKKMTMKRRSNESKSKEHNIRGKWKSVLLVAFIAFVAEKATSKARVHFAMRGKGEVVFRSSGAGFLERFPSSSSSSLTTTTTTTTTEILAVVTVGWQISSSSNERKRHLRRIIENYREMCAATDDGDAPRFKRVTVAVAAYDFDAESMTSFLSSSSEHFFRSSRRNGDWQISLEEEKSSDGRRVTIERAERALKMNYVKENRSSSLPCEFALDLELFGFREIDGTKSHLTPGDLALRHRDIFLRRILSDCEDCDDESSDKVLFIVQEDDVYLDKKHISSFLETSKLTESANKFAEEGKGSLFYHPFFFDYEKDSDGVVYADWRVNAGFVQKWNNNQTIFTSTKASGGGRSLMIRGRSRLQDLLFSSESSSSVGETRVAELREWLDPLSVHPGEFNVEVATNRWIERKVHARVHKTKARRQVRFLLPLSSGVVDAKHRAGSLETLLDSAGIWHASNTYVERRKELSPLDPTSPSKNKKNQETLERLRWRELQQIFRSCFEEGQKSEEEEEGGENECFRCLSVSSEKKAEYRARVVVDDDDEKRRTRRRRRRIDVVFSCA